MSTLHYSEADLLAEHPYARPQIEAGYRLHGGFDAAGSYLSPRTLKRWPAVREWQKALQEHGFPLIDASTKLLRRGNYPSFEQQKLLLDLGLGQTLWNSLTITGFIEARGRRLVDFPAPDFQRIVAEDIAGTATGHLGRGLMKAHGLDEGGNPDAGEGGHDTMWFAVRDLLFGKDAYPLPAVPESLARPELGRLMPQIPPEFEQTVLMLMNVLMIEIRAEAFFAFCTRLMRAPELFADRRADADHAAVLVERIRQDEAIHVAYLQTAVSELRSFTFRAESGGEVAGKAFIDPVWNGMVHWHSVTTLEHGRVQARDAIAARLLEAPDGARRLAAFDALEPREAA
ncbi:MAG TPA: hypothetical protein VE397_03080 [Stellaceae bacterium]|jgi:hypothetical protein|nr:hypothetical protein [Stellaceae bacterium]